MDLQRSLLIGAIAVLSFMLLTEWVAFKDEKAATQTQQTTRLITNGADASPGEVPELPQAEPEVSPGGLSRSEPTVCSLPSISGAATLSNWPYRVTWNSWTIRISRSYCWNRMIRAPILHKVV